MLVSTMSDAEKRMQATRDTVEVMSHIRHKLYKTLVREVKKFNKFPRVLRYSYVTRSGNKYYILFRAESRTEFDKHIWFQSYTIMDSNEGKYAMAAITDFYLQVESFQIYTPHLFARYSERCGINLHEEERIHQFMKESTKKEYGGTHEYETGKVMAPVERGMILGEAKEYAIVFKTFVDYERLYGNQIETGEQTIDNFLKKVELYEKVTDLRRRYRKYLQG